MAASSSDRERYLTGVLQATALKSTSVELPRAKRSVDVLTMLRREQPWPGSEPESFRVVPKKPALQFNDRSTWAEFILLRLLERDGWKGAWVKNWDGRAFWRDVLEICDLPSSASAWFHQIEKHAGGRGGGCWDIFVCGDEFLFIESFGCCAPATSGHATAPPPMSVMNARRFTRSPRRRERAANEVG
jgi:hypothetical protein